MASLPERLMERLRPREGWALLLFTLVALLCTPAALMHVDQELGATNLMILTLLAVIVGMGLARSRLSARAAALGGGLVGIALIAILVGRILPPPSLIWRELGYTASWIGQRWEGIAIRPLPFATTLGYLWQRIVDLGLRLWWLRQSVASGGTAQDPILFLLLSSAVTWATALFASWQIFRRRNALTGLMPSGLGLATVAFFLGGLAAVYVLVFLFCTLCLLAICHLRSRQEEWDRANIDYPGDMGLDLTLALGPWIVALVLLASFFPVVYPGQIRDAFWRVMNEPWSTVVEVSEQLFGPLEGLGPGGAGSAGVMPQSHLLGGQPNLARTIVFYVSTSDPPPPRPEPEEIEPLASSLPRRYWRGATFDVYTGIGWTNTPLEQRSSSPGELLDPYTSGPEAPEQGGPPIAELHQQFERTLPEQSLLHASNAPLQVDQPVRSWWRGPGDLAQMQGDAIRYTVVSAVPEPSIADLGAASPDLSPDIAERYLALPESVPERVLNLATEVVGDAETRYDQAHAIEHFLRAYTYTLELPPPPTEVDLVDHFLFDLQEGYCDYYASAMVVMARSVGIPARLASGYAQGTYDHDEERWVVTEKDGHSWVEVYFDGIGWVEFEPTAGQPALVRTGTQVAAPAIPPLPPRAPGGIQVPWGILILGGLLALLAGIMAWIWWPRHRQPEPAAGLVRDRHERLVRWGQRLDHPLRDGQTSSEYALTLSDSLQNRGKKSRWASIRHDSTQVPDEVEQLTDAFVRAQYSPEPLSFGESWEIRDLWLRLRRRLWRLWLLHR